jgi:hypothetical protein
LSTFNLPSVSPPPSKTFIDEANEKRVARENRPSLGQSLADAAATSWVAPYVAKHVYGWRYDEDPDYEVNGEELARLGVGLPPEYLPEFGRAVSRDHAEQIRTNLLDLNERRERLSQLGWQGTALSVGAMIFDPVFLAGGIASTAASALLKGGRAARFAQAGLINAAPEVLFESMRAEQSPDADARDVVFAGMLAFTVGGALDGLAGGRISDAGRRAVRTADREAVEKSSSWLSPSGLNRMWDKAKSDAKSGDNAVGGKSAGTSVPPGGSARDAKTSASSIDLSDTDVAQGFYDAAETGKPFSVKAYRTGVEGKENFDRGVFFGDQYYVGRLAETTGDPVFSRTIVAQNPLVFWSKQHYLDTLGKQGDSEAARLADQMRERAAAFTGADRESGKGIDFSEAEKYIAKVARREGHDAYISQFEIEVVALDPSVFQQSSRATGGDNVIGMGAASPGLQGGMNPLAEKNISDMIADGTITPNGAKYLNDSEAVAKRREDTMNMMELDDADKEMYRAMDDDAFFNATATNPKFDTDGGLEVGDFNPTGGSERTTSPTGNVRHVASIQTELGNSASPMVRTYGNDMLNDPLPKKGGVAGPVDTGELSSEMNRARLMVPFMRTYKENFNKWYAVHKGSFKGFLKRVQAERKFKELVGEAKRAGGVGVEPEIAAVAKAADKVFADGLGFMQRHGVLNADKIEHALNYLPRVAQTYKTRAIESRYGTAGAGKDVRAFLQRAVKSAYAKRGEEIDDDIAYKIGGVWLNHAKNRNTHSDLDMWRRVNGLDPDGLREMLKNEIPDITDDQIKAVAFGIEGPDVAKNSPDRLKKRVLIDEDYAETMHDGQTLRFVDFLDSDIVRITNAYARDAVGSGITSMVYRKFGSSGTDTSIYSFSQLKQAMKKELEGLGVADDEIARQLSIVEKVDKHIRGLPLEPTTDVVNGLRRGRAVANLVVNGVMGVAQLADVGMMVGGAGFGVMWKQMPALGEIAKSIVTGKSIGVVNDIDNIYAMLGTQSIRSNFSMQLDDFYEGSGFWNNVDYALYKANKFSNWTNGLTPITMFTQKAAAVLAAQKVVDIAVSGKKLSPKRLAAMSLTPEQGERIFAAIRKQLDDGVGITREKGLFGNRINRFDPTKWDDSEAATLFIAATARFGTRVSNIADFGSVAPWMTKEVAKTLFQYRFFMYKSYRNALSRGVALHDFDTFREWSTSALMAGIGYMGTEYAYSLGQDNPEKYREERLGEGAFLKAAFQRSSFSSITPTIADTFMQLSQRDPIFAYGNTGLGRSLFSAESTPSVSLATNAIRGIQGSIGAATSSDQEFGQSDARAWSKVVPFRRVLGVKNVLDRLVESFPEE